MKDEFIKEFNALLKKYNVCIRAYDNWTGYPECGEDIQIDIDSDEWSIDELGSAIDEIKDDSNGN